MDRSNLWESLRRNGGKRNTNAASLCKRLNKTAMESILQRLYKPATVFRGLIFFSSLLSYCERYENITSRVVVPFTDFHCTVFSFVCFRMDDGIASRLCTERTISIRSNLAAVIASQAHAGK